MAIDESLQREKLIFEQFKREIKAQVGKLLDLEPILCVKLIDEKFEEAHGDMIDSLKKD